MKPIKLKIRTKTENYPVIIGSSLINNLNSYLNKKLFNLSVSSKSDINKFTKRFY